MSEKLTQIPDDVMKAAREALCTALTVSRSRSADDGFETIARALLAEREKQAARIAKLEAALNGMVDMYVELVNSGDAGFWDPEKNEYVIAARAALKPEGEAE